MADEKNKTEGPAVRRPLAIALGLAVAAIGLRRDRFALGLVLVAVGKLVLDDWWLGQCDTHEAILSVIDELEVPPHLAQQAKVMFTDLHERQNAELKKAEAAEGMH